jgi:hypothetical protein
LSTYFNFDIRTSSPKSLHLSVNKDAPSADSTNVQRPENVFILSEQERAGDDMVATFASSDGGK